MAKVQHIDLGYLARPQFVPLHMRKQRWACVVSHVRAGKTVSCLMDLVDAALRCQKPDPRFAYVAPYYTQAKDVAWMYLKRFTAPIPGATTHEQELRVDLPGGGRVRLYGADNYDRMRGIYLDGVVLDEPADFHPAAWPEVIRPRLSDRGGWATFIGTPKGRNAFFDVYEYARTNPQEWFSLVLRASETGILSADELADARKSLTPEQYEQEYECSFDAAILGAYYGREIADADRQGRITHVPYDPHAPCFTAWDLGKGVNMAIWVFQLVGDKIHVLDFIEGEHADGIPHMVERLRELPYPIAADWVPHDAQITEIGTGRTRVETLFKLGRKPRLVPGHKVMDGIHATRLALPRVYFDREKCAEGIEALRQYASEYDDKMRAFKDNPRPTHWSNHAADAFRYVNMASIEITPAAKPKKLTKVNFPAITANDLVRMSGQRDRRWE